MVFVNIQIAKFITNINEISQFKNLWKKELILPLVFNIFYYSQSFFIICYVTKKTVTKNKKKTEDKSDHNKNELELEKELELELEC